MNYGIEDPTQLDEIDNLLNNFLVETGGQCVLLIDTAGNRISQSDDRKCSYDLVAFPALAAGNYATVDSLAKIVGEPEFSLLYHKGEKVSIHFSKVSEDLLIINIFDNKISLGLLRLKVSEVIKEIRSICQPAEAENCLGAVMNSSG